MKMQAEEKIDLDIIVRWFSIIPEDISLNYRRCSKILFLQREFLFKYFLTISFAQGMRSGKGRKLLPIVLFLLIKFYADDISANSNA